MTFSPDRVLLFLLLACAALCEDWFMPDSRLISDVEFKEALTSTSTYKMVKFFTPNCVYCRYLKNVFDTLKAERHWSFQIYDLNCNWYPQLCSELKIGAFPHTNIYDENGKLDTEINGFYPQPVIRDIFEQAETATEEVKRRSTRNLNPHQEAPKQQIKTLDEENSRSQPNDLRTPQQPTHPQQEVIAIEEKQAIVHDSVQARPEVKKTSEPHPSSHAQLTESHLSGIYQHIFFAICILLGVVYFGSFMHLIKPPKSRLNPEAVESFPKMQGEFR